MKREIDFTDVHQICAEHQIEIRELKSVSGSFGKKIFFINQELLLRVSEAPMTLEQEKFRRIATLNFVPKIVHTGALKRKGGLLHYTLLTLLPGDDFVNVYQEMTEAQQIQLGVDTAGFLENLQEFHGQYYDIGLYVAALPHFSGTWRDGHQQYWELLKQESGKLHLKPDSLQVFDSAFRFLQASAKALVYQSGPKLLHNDF
ncbi:MAG: phosphotransferase, partial [Anaerolineae bacterium]|nr:phosphotransferase [Anaerolineae bacterium]